MYVKHVLIETCFMQWYMHDMEDTWFKHDVEHLWYICGIEHERNMHDTYAGVPFHAWNVQ